jgi:hypothetical protein
MRMAVEEHGGGRQLLRFRIWPRCSRAGLAFVATFAALTAGAIVDGNRLGALLLGIAALLVAASMVRDCAAAMGMLVPAVRHHADEPRPEPAPEPAANGAVATTLISRMSGNGHHAAVEELRPDPQVEVTHLNGSNGGPPVPLREPGLNLSDREDLR